MLAKPSDRALRVWRCSVDERRSATTGAQLTNQLVVCLRPSAHSQHLSLLQLLKPLRLYRRHSRPDSDIDNSLIDQALARLHTITQLPTDPLDRASGVLRGPRCQASWSYRPCRIAFRSECTTKTDVRHRWLTTPLLPEGPMRLNGPPLQGILDLRRTRDGSRLLRRWSSPIDMPADGEFSGFAAISYDQQRSSVGARTETWVGVRSAPGRVRIAPRTSRDERGLRLRDLACICRWAC